MRQHGVLDIRRDIQLRRDTVLLREILRLLVEQIARVCRHGDTDERERDQRQRARKHKIQQRAAPVLGQDDARPVRLEYAHQVDVPFPQIERRADRDRHAGHRDPSGPYGHFARIKMTTQ